MRRFIKSHLWVPLALLIVALGGDIYWELDLRLADVLFAWQGEVWALQHHWVTEGVMHSGGRLLSGTMLMALFLALIRSFMHEGWRHYRSGLVYLTATILVSFALINGLKAISGVPCPWDVARYGGNNSLHEWFAGLSGEHGCFPAGHASGGYVWVALYFFALIHHFERRYQALALGIGLGIVFGIAQQVRGAHFLSHDIVTLAICWFTSLIGFLLWFRQNVPLPVHAVPTPKE